MPMIKHKVILALLLKNRQTFFGRYLYQTCFFGWMLSHWWKLLQRILLKFLFCKDFWFFFSVKSFPIWTIKKTSETIVTRILYALEFVYGRKIIGAVVIWPCFSTKNLVRAIFVLLKSSKFEEQEDVIKYISFSKYLSPPLTKIGIVHMYTDHNSVITSIFITKNVPQNDIVPVPFPAPRKMGHQLFSTTQMNFYCGAFKLQRLADWAIRKQFAKWRVPASSTGGFCQFLLEKCFWTNVRPRTILEP